MSRSSLIFLAINIASWLLSVFLSFPLWAPPGAEQMSPAGFDVIVWVVVALPICVITLVMNVFWLTRTLLRLRRIGLTRVAPELWCLLFVALAWGGGLAFHITHLYQGGL